MTEGKKQNGCQEDHAIDTARAMDCMRDELWADWVERGKSGMNPDELPADQLNASYAQLVTKRHEMQDMTNVVRLEQARAAAVEGATPEALRASVIR